MRGNAGENENPSWKKIAASDSTLPSKMAAEKEICSKARRNNCSWYGSQERF